MLSSAEERAEARAEARAVADRGRFGRTERQQSQLQGHHRVCSEPRLVPPAHRGQRSSLRLRPQGRSVCLTLKTSRVSLSNREEIRAFHVRPDRAFSERRGPASASHLRLPVHHPQQQRRANGGQFLRSPASLLSWFLLRDVSSPNTLQAEDAAPPRPPLPRFYDYVDTPPAVPPLPKEASVIRHTSVRGLKRQSDERRRDRESGQYVANGDAKVRWPPVTRRDVASNGV